MTTDFSPAEIIDKLHALGLNDISGAITRERLFFTRALTRLLTQRDDLFAALKGYHEWMTQARADDPHGWDTIQRDIRVRFNLALPIEAAEAALSKASESP